MIITTHRRSINSHGGIKFQHKFLFKARWRQAQSIVGGVTLPTNISAIFTYRTAPPAVVSVHPCTSQRGAQENKRLRCLDCKKKRSQTLETAFG